MSNKTRLWVLVTGIFCAALILFGFVGGLVPQIADASVINDQTETQTMLNEMQRSRIDELASQKPQTQQLEDELTKLEAAIPASIDSAGLLRDLEALQQSSGAMVTGVSLGTPLAAEVEAPAVAATTDGEEEGLTAPADLPETPAFSGGIFEVPLTLDISGSFEQVREFVRALQLNERLVFANAIEINGSGDLYTAVVDAVVFALPA